MARSAKTALADPSLIDQRVHLHGVSWSDYERLLELRGDECGTWPRARQLERAALQC